MLGRHLLVSEELWGSTHSFSHHKLEVMIWSHSGRLSIPGSGVTNKRNISKEDCQNWKKNFQSCLAMEGLDYFCWRPEFVFSMSTHTNKKQNCIIQTKSNKAAACMDEEVNWLINKSRIIKDMVDLTGFTGPFKLKWYYSTWEFSCCPGCVQLNKRKVFVILYLQIFFLNLRFMSIRLFI